MNCNIPNTHRRLIEAHRLWHQCKENYFEPEGFRTNLNALIQSLRNITFILQSEKSRIEGYDVWYPNWQSKMKADPVMKWLNEARVQIVHQNDLETKSIAKIKVFSYIEISKSQFDLPPMMPAKMIAHYVKQLVMDETNIPEHQLNECIVEVERNWIADDLPDIELLDATAHCFKLLKDIVDDAHKNNGMGIVTCPLRDKLHSLSNVELSNEFLCMKSDSSYKTKRIVLGDFTERTTRKKPVTATPDELKKAEKRYLSKTGKQLFPLTDEDPFILADKLNKVALTVLKKDKYHQSIRFIRVPGRGWEIHSINAEDKADKFLLSNELAKYVSETGADSIIDINEAWVSSDIEEISQGTPVKDTPNRREALFINVITSTGKIRSYTTFFKRGYLGNIIPSETEIDDENPGLYLKPVLDVWGIQVDYHLGVKTTKMER